MPYCWVPSKLQTSQSPEGKVVHHQYINSHITDRKHKLIEVQNVRKTSNQDHFWLINSEPHLNTSQVTISSRWPNVDDTMQFALY